MGHSHGGNVILYALQELASQGLGHTVDSVVTLATPYITANPRPLKKAFGVIGILAGLTAWMVLGYLYATLFFDSVEKINSTLNLIFAGIVFTVGGIGLAKYVHGLIYNKEHDRVVKIAQIEANKIRAKAPPNTPLLSVSVTGDEALGGLRIVERTASSPVKLWKFLTTLAGFAFVVGLVVSAFFVDTAYEDMADRAFANVLTIAFLTLIGALLLLWVFSLLRIPAFGAESLLLRTCLDIEVEAKPSGVENAPFKEMTFKKSELEPELKGLKHSVPYQSEQVLTELSHWIINTSGT